MKPFTGQTTQSLQRELADHYAQSIDDMSKMTIMGLETQEHKHLDTPKNVMMIANNEGYAKPEVGAIVINGNALSYRAEPGGRIYPIGYNIFIPNGVEKINKVIVSAYGGFTRAEESYVSTPSSPYRLANHLLNEGCVFIDLNLPDFLLNVPQSNMDASLQRIIHAGIDTFFQKISHEPSSLSDKLQGKGFQNADFYLIGASFGGRTALRHGQLYPGTFKGYISHDGALTANDYKHGKDILPVHHLQDTQEPVLILQNCDDNNVKLTTAIDFYEALMKAGKQDLARICFFEKGSPMPETEDKWNKGHFYPERELPRYMDTIDRFIHQGPPAIPQLHKVFMLKQKKLASSFFRGKNVQERFLALATQKYYDNPTHQVLFPKQKEWDEIWKTEYLPLLQGNEEANYLAIYNVAYKEHIDYLVSQNLLTNEVISKAIKFHSAIYREYFKESARFKEISDEDIYNNPYIIEAFRNRLINPNYYDSSESKSFVLESLFFSDPSLVPSIAQSKTWSEDRLNKTNEQYKQLFEASVKESKASIQDTWRSVTKKVIEKQKRQREKFNAMPAKAELSDNSVLYEQLFLMDSFFIGNAAQAKIAYDKKQTHLINTTLELANEQLQALAQKNDLSKDSLDVINISRQMLESPQYQLSPANLETLKEYLNKNTNAQDIDVESTIKLIYYVLLIDKSRSSLSPSNLVKGIKRQLLLQQYLENDKIEYQARKAFIHSLHELFPDLSQSTILSLIKSVNESKSFENSPYSIQEAIFEGNTSLARALLQLGVPISHTSELEFASKLKDLKLIKMLIDRGEQVTPKCLVNALEGDPNIIQLLCEHGGDPIEREPLVVNQPGHIIFENPVFLRMVYRAVTEDDATLKKVVDQIATKHGCIEELTSVTQETSKLLLGELSEIEIIENIKKNNLSITFKDANGQNLLMLAAKKNYPVLMTFLIEQGIDVSLKDNHGHSALIHALFNQHFEMAKTIIEAQPKTTPAPQDVELIEFCRKELCEKRFNSTSPLKPATIYYDNAVQQIDKSVFNKLLKLAVDQGNISCAAELLVCVMGKDATDRPPVVGMEQGKPLMSRVLDQKAYEFALSLLKAGDDPNKPDTSNNAPLALAIENRLDTFVDELIKLGANPNSKNRHMQSSLSLAMENLNSHLVFRLLELGANVHVTNKQNETPLIEAINHHLPEVAMACIKRGGAVNVVDRFGVDALRRSIEKGFVDVSIALMENGADLDKPDWKKSTPLIELCRFMKSFDLAVELINRGANVNARDNNGDTPLKLVLSHCKTEQEITLAHLLIDKGADVTEADLWMAIHSDNLGLVDKLLQRGVDINAPNKNSRASSRHQTPLEWAITSGNTELALFLIQKGANVNDTYHFGETPLSLAAGMGNKSVGLKLIDHGAVVDSLNEMGNTPLGNALQKGHEDVVFMLMDNGANHQHKNNLSMPILSFASEELQQRVQDYAGVMQSRSKPLVPGLKSAQKLLNVPTKAPSVPKDKKPRPSKK